MNNDSLKYILIFVFALVVLIVLLVIIAQIKRAIRRGVNRVTRKITGGFAAASLVKSALDQANAVTESAPKSLSNLESIHLPMIRKKYPDLQIDSLRNQAGIALKEYLDSVQRKTPTAGLEKLSAKSLCDTVFLLSGEKYKNEPFSLHRAVISSYETDRIGFQIAYRTDKERKASVTFCYMKETKKENDAPLATCENCGATLSREAMAAGHCLYCEQILPGASPIAWLVVKIIID